MRSVRSEMATLATVMAVPLAVLLAFPFDAVGFRAAAVETAHPFAAFVTLTEAQEETAVKAAKTSWIGVSGDYVNSPRADLPFGVLPDSKSAPVLRLSDRPFIGMPAPAPTGPVSYLPSLAAPPPARLPNDPRTDEQPFTRAELMHL